MMTDVCWSEDDVEEEEEESERVSYTESESSLTTERANRFSVRRKETKVSVKNRPIIMDIHWYIKVIMAVITMLSIFPYL